MVGGVAVRYGIFSDVHGNLEALDAVLATFTEESVDRLVCLGDIVGYGADPRACIERLRERNVISVAGNHDAAACGSINIELFNTYAANAINWTRSQLGPGDEAFLRELPLTFVEEGVTFAHATLDRPEWYEYLQTPDDALASLRVQATRAAFIGHSHSPITFLLSSEKLLVNFDSHLSLRPFEKGIFNVGSVGQPRDQDPRACCAIYDTILEDFRLNRVPYDIDRAGEKIVRAGLPSLLAERLRAGV